MEYEKLAFVARSVLHESSPRVMAVLDPVQVTISNLAALMEAKPGAEGQQDATASFSLRLTEAAKEGSLAEVECCVPDFPHDPSRGTHALRCSDKVS